VYARLSADTSLASLVSTRIYNGYLPQSPTFPAITYEMVSVVPVNSLTTNDGTTQNSRLRVHCWAEDKSDAVAVRDAVRSVITTAGSDFTAITLTAGDIYEEDVELHRIIVDFSLWSNET
jgi:hypothetical protein